jgi:hypothetical protein
MTLTLIYFKNSNKLILTKRYFKTWEEEKAYFDDYQTSLIFASLSEFIKFYLEDFGNLSEKELNKLHDFYVKKDCIDFEFV